MKVSGNFKSALIIDDEAEIRNTYQTILEKEGLLIDTAESGESALEKLVEADIRESQYNFILSDIRMEGMNGLELSEYVGRLYPSLTVVLFSAYGDEHRAEALEAGMEIIDKFAPTDEIIARIKKAISEVETRIEIQETKDALEERDKSIDSMIETFCQDADSLVDEIDGFIRVIGQLVYDKPFELMPYLEFLKENNIAEYFESLKDFNRTIHTLKGTAGMFGLNQLKEYCHALEDLSVSVQNGKIILDAGTFGIIKDSYSTLKFFLSCINEEYSDQNVQIEDEIKEMKECKQKIFEVMNGSEINLEDISNSDLGKVRTRKRQINIKIPLEVYDGLIDAAQKLLTVNQAFVYLKGGELLNDMVSASQVPIDLSRYQRIVEDAKKSLGKDILFKIDRNSVYARPDVWEHIHNALIHLVRNSIDHGIEDPVIREGCGKPRQGNIKLEVYEDHKNIFLVLSDDGKGIDPEKVAESAIKKGIISNEEVAGMSKEGKQMLIFRAGFSTKESTSSISGRGVGMDAISKEIEGKLGGTLHIDSKKGEGTVFSAEIPKSDALSQCVIFGDDERTFAIHKVPDIKYFPYDPKFVVKTTEKIPIYVKDEWNFPILDVFKTLGICRANDHNKSDSIILVHSESDEKFGLVVPYIKGHQLLRVQREKFNRDNPSTFGYAFTDREIVVCLDLDHLYGKKTSPTPKI